MSEQPMTPQFGLTVLEQCDDNGRQFQPVLSAIRDRLAASSTTIEQAIEQRHLYFRVSLVGSCNLSCPFCHNEGAAKTGRMNVDFASRLIRAAVNVGFRRVQLTGGEPLLHPELRQFIEAARSFVTDVGVTTNGTHVLRRRNDLAKSGLTRMHLSLMEEPLRDAGVPGTWGVPAWLEDIITFTNLEGIALRLNLPVPQNELRSAAQFLETMRAYQCDLKVFALLPSGTSTESQYPLRALQAVVEKENRGRAQVGLTSRVIVRDYLRPSGIRCSECGDRDSCKEASRSLRLGADGVLRPCLATRTWDARVIADRPLEAQLEDAALLALDYVW